MIQIVFTVFKELFLKWIVVHYGIGNPLGNYKQYGCYSAQVSFPNEFDRPWWLVRWACPKGVEPIEWNHEKDFVVDPITFNACRVYKFRIRVNGKLYDAWGEECSG